VIDIDRSVIYIIYIISWIAVVLHGDGDNGVLIEAIESIEFTEYFNLTVTYGI